MVAGEQLIDRGGQREPGLARFGLGADGVDAARVEQPDTVAAFTDVRLRRRPAVIKDLVEVDGSPATAEGRGVFVVAHRLRVGRGGVVLGPRGGGHAVASSSASARVSSKSARDAW